MVLRYLTFFISFIAAPLASAAEPALPPAASRKVDFRGDIQPLLETSCVQCHAKGRTKAGFSVETREAFVKGGDSGPAAVPGKSADSYVVQLVASHDADEVMPKKGTRWTPQQIGLLRAWIDQGMDWPAAVSFAKPVPNNLSPRSVGLPEGHDDDHPLDRLVGGYFKTNGIAAPGVVDDRTFARRVHLDLVGLPPSPGELDAFVASGDAGKRLALVRRLLADNAGYAEHWLTFWNDLLRNDYKGTGFIDGGRKQITGWLYTSLATNKPYDQFVRELVNPIPASEGFSKGIVWRGTVPASMTPPMQAAQSVAQAFFGVNLKCASCHDSFTSDWMLADAYGLAAIYADKPLEMVRCDAPLGKTAEARFLYPQIGTIDPKLPRAEKIKRFAELITSPQNGRLSRNIVNRLWQRLIGVGLVEPLDDMDKPAWSPDMLDWLAEDLVAHKYDLKRTIELIVTSKAYQLPVVDAPAEGSKVRYVFRGPVAKRLTAEQFADTVSLLTGEWGKIPSSVEFDFTAGGTVAMSAKPTVIWTDVPVAEGIRRSARNVLTKKPAATPATPAPAKPNARQARAARQAKDSDRAAVDRDPKGSAPNAKEAPTVSDAPKSDPLVAEATPTAPKEPKAPDAAAIAANKAAQARAQLVLDNPEMLATLAAAPEKLDRAFASLVRHRVVFRKVFTLDAPPDLAYAAVAASQKVELLVNGKPAPVGVSDRARQNRQAVFDLRTLLKKGENLIVLSVESHTERPNGREDDREKAPAAYNHLNHRSGVTFYANVMVAGKRSEWTTDGTWRTSREPADGWQVDVAEKEPWSPALVLPAGQVASDDGPVIDDDGRVPAGKAGEDIAVRIRGLAAMASRTGSVRASLMSSDPMQLALDRPNREQLVSCRQNAATTIQALELTNGATLDAKLKKSAAKLAADAAIDPAAWAESLYLRTLCRKPTAGERQAVVQMLGEKPTPEAIADVLWAVLMQAEFQYVH